VHPIERLRYVARAAGADPCDLVRESVAALASFGADAGGLVTACRRLVGRHPTAGPIWWLAARMLTATDARAAGWDACDELEADPTARLLVDGLADRASMAVVGWPEQLVHDLPRRGDVEVLVVDALGEGSGLVRRLQGADVDAVDVPESGLGAAVAEADVLVLDATAAGPGGVAAVAGSRAAAAVARHAGVPVWAAVGVGRALPAPLWRAIAGRVAECPLGTSPVDIVPIDLVDIVIGPDGRSDAEVLTRRADCPVAPELLKEV
jgi:hypothetical protein